MPRINLLPHRAAARAKRKKDFLIYLGIAAATGIALVYASKLTVQSSISNQLARNAILKNEISDLDKQIEEIKGLENQRERLVARMKVIGELQRSRPEVVHLFDEIVKTLPEGVHLTEVKQTGNRIEFQGQAESSTRVSSMMRNIDSSEFLSDPTLDGITTATSGQDHVSQFKLFAQQVSTANADDEDKSPNVKPTKGAAK